MNKALQIFYPTFNKVPTIQPLIATLRNCLVSQNFPYYLNQTATLYYLSNRIIQQISQLQSNQSLKIISYFDEKFQHFDYDYQKNMFVLERLDRNKTTVRCNLKSLNLQPIDHPTLRNTLYFHELKDITKYYKPTKNYSMPKFMKQFELQKFSDHILDQKNPLGLPLHAQKLLVNFQFTKDNIVCGFDLQSTMGEINLKKAYNYQNGRKFNIDCQLLEEETQQLLFEFLRTKTNLQPSQYRQLHSLAFIGGRIQSTQFTYKYFTNLIKGIELQAKSKGLIPQNPPKQQFINQQQQQQQEFIPFPEMKFSKQQLDRIIKQIPTSNSPSKK